MAKNNDNVKFIQQYLSKLNEEYFTIQQLIPPDITDFQPDKFYPPTPNEERAAQLADDCGCDIRPFQGYRSADDIAIDMEDNECHISKQIRVLEQILVKLKKPPATTIPNNAKLLSVSQVALMLGWGESVVRQRDKAGLLPKAIKTGGTIQWNRQELNSWMNAGCPARQQWEMTKTGKGVL